MAGSDERIEIVIEATNQASAAIKSVTADLKGLGDNVKLNAAVIKENLSSQNEYFKDLAASLAVRTKIESDAAKEYAAINALRIAGNKQAVDSDKERAVNIANQARMEVSAAKQSAAEYAAINALRIKGNKEAFDQYDKDTAKKIADDAREAKKGVQEFGSSLGEISGLVKKAFASYLVYEFLSTLKDATSAVLNWMGNIETYGIAIAASLQVGGKYIDSVTGKALEGNAAFAAASAESASVIEALQVANFQTVATLDQLIRMYQEALPIAMKKGFDKKMVQDFTLSVTQAASAMGVSMDMMAEEARSLLTGAINMRNSRVAVALGITPEDIRQNSTNADTLFNFLMEKLAVYRIAGEALQNSWRGLWSNFKDLMMQAGGKALEPLFEGIKQHLKEVIDSIATLDTVAGKIVWNPEFLEGVEAIKSGLKEALYYARLFKEVGSAGVGGVQAVGKSGLGGVFSAFNPLGVMQDVFSGKLPAGLGAVSDLFTGNKNRVFGDFSLDPLKDYFKDRNVSASKFAATQAISQSGMGERSYIDTYIKKAAEKYGVEASDLAGIINAESSFINKTSLPDKQGKRAYGYMQLRESTAKDLGLGLDDIMDPEKNIMAGAKYYSQLLNQFGGDREKALKSYNKGPGFIGNYEAGKYDDESKTYKVYGKIQTSKDLEKNYAEAEGYYNKVDKYSQEMGKSDYYGRGTQAKFQPNVELSENEKEAIKTRYEKNIAKLKRDEEQALDDAKQAGQTKKALDKAGELDDESRIKNKEQRVQFELQVDQDTTKQQLEIKKKYLADYTDWTDAMDTIDTGKESKAGIFKDSEEKEKHDEKVKDTKAKLLREISQLETNLVVQGANERAAVNEQEQKKLETTYSERAKLAQSDYDELKKINSLKVEFGEITPTEAYEVEEAALKNLIRAKLELIAVQLQEKGLGDKEVALRAQQAKLIQEYDQAELSALEKRQKDIATIQIKQKRLEELNSAQIAYNAAIADPNAMEALSRRNEISKLEALADIALLDGKIKLAAIYRETAKVLQESNNRGDFWGGITDGLDAMVNKIGSVRGQISGLVQGIGGDMKTSLSGLIYDSAKGNINYDKDREVYDSTNKLKYIEDQKAILTLQKEQISGNAALSTSDKATATAAIDAKLKQLDVEKQLAEAQKQAAENSKSLGDTWQGFLDSITKKAADFMADAAIQELFSFLSGNMKEGTKTGGVNILTRFVDLITGAKTEVQSGMNDISGTVSQGMSSVADAVNSGGSGIAGSFGNIFSGLAKVAQGWMEVIYKYVVDYLKEIMASLASSGFGGFGGGGEGDAAGDIGGVAADVGYWHTGGYVTRMHKGGSVLRYHAGGLKHDEVPIVAQKGEYVLSKKDVEFVDKVKGGGTTINMNIAGGGGGGQGKTTIVPLGVTVMVDNQSSALLQASAQARQSKNEQEYIIDVVMKNINSRGSLGGWR